jgi:hypothetical protein
MIRVVEALALTGALDPDLDRATRDAALVQRRTGWMSRDPEAKLDRSRGDAKTAAIISAACGAG